MTPLTLLAVGVIVVLIFLCGCEAERTQGSLPSVIPVLIGLAMIGWGLLWIIGLGIKEAAK